MSSLQKSIFSLTIIILLGQYAYASDRQFTYTYQSKTLGKNQRELEVWKWITAFNVVGEWEFEHEYSNDEKKVRLEGDDAKLEFNLGVAYQIKPDFTLGIEARQHNVFEEEQDESMKMEHSALFAGPCF